MDYKEFADSILGTQAPTKRDQVVNVTNQKKEETVNATQQAKELLDEISPQPTTVVRDSQGTIIGSGVAGDADSQLGNRLNDPRDGYSYDAWETYHEGVTPDPKKMAKQRKNLALLSGIPEDQITNEDVYKMGEYAKQQKDSLASKTASSNINEVTQTGVNGKGKFGRDLVTETGADNKNTITAMNTPLTNADFYSDYNKEGQSSFYMGNTNLDGHQAYTEREVNTSTMADLHDHLIAIGDAAVNVGVNKPVNFALDNIDALKNSKMFDAGEKTVVSNIITKRKEAEYNAKIEQEIQNAKAQYIKDNPDAKDADKRFKSTGFSTDPSKNIQYTKEEKDYLDTGWYNDENSSASVQSRKLTQYKSGEEAVQSLMKSDNFRKSVTDTIANSTINKTILNDRFKTDTKAGDTVLGSNNFATDFYIEKAARDLRERDTITSKALEEGRYGDAAVSMFKTAGKLVTDHPQAAIRYVAESLPDMAFNIYTGGAGLMVQTNDSYRNQKDEFIKLHKRQPNSNEQQIMVALAGLKAASDRGADQFILGGGLEKLGSKVTDFLIKKGINGSVAAKAVAQFTVGTASEGAQEMMTDLFEQVGARGGSTDNLDYNRLGQAGSRAIASGAVMSGTVAAKDIPTGVTIDTKNAVELGKKIIDKAKGNSTKDVVTEATTNDSEAVKENQGMAAAIAKNESGSRGYNAYNTGQAGQGKEHIDLTNMTLGEIRRRQQLPKGDPNRLWAVGNFQVTGNTLPGAMQALGLSENDKFTVETQNKIFSEYLANKGKRKPIYDYITGSGSIDKAQIALAQEWTSVARDSSGLSWNYGSEKEHNAATTHEQAQQMLKDARATYAAKISEGMEPEVAYREALGISADFKSGSNTIKSTDTNEISDSGNTTTTNNDSTFTPENNTEGVELDNVKVSSNFKIKIKPVEVKFTLNPQSTDEVLSNNAKEAELAINIDSMEQDGQTDSKEYKQAKQELNDIQNTSSDVDMSELLAMLNETDSALQNSAIAKAISGGLDLSTVDHSKLSEPVSNMITRIQELNLNPKTESTLNQKFKTQNSLNSKFGLAQHMKNIASVLPTGNEELVNKGFTNFNKFIDSQQYKIDQLQYAVDNNLKSINYSTDDRKIFKLESIPKTQNFINKLKREQDTLLKGKELLINLKDNMYSSINDDTSNATDTTNTVTSTNQKDTSSIEDKISKDLNVQNESYIEESSRAKKSNKDNPKYIPNRILETGSAKVIVDHIKSTLPKEHAHTSLVNIVSKLVDQQDINVVTQVKDKLITRPFAHYKTRTVGLVPTLDTNVSMPYMGTSPSYVLHELSHILLNDYLSKSPETDIQKALQKEYKRIVDVYNKTLAKDIKKNKNKNIPEALQYAANASELYAMSINSKLVNEYLKSIPDTTSKAKGFTLLDSLWSLATKVLDILQGKHVTLQDSVNALRLNALKDLASEIQDGNTYIQALTENEELPLRVYRSLLNDPVNLTKDGKVKVDILNKLGIHPNNPKATAKVRDELHSQVGVNTEFKAPTKSKSKAKSKPVIKNTETVDTTIDEDTVVTDDTLAEIVDEQYFEDSKPDTRSKNVKDNIDITFEVKPVKEFKLHSVANAITDYIGSIRFTSVKAGKQLPFKVGTIKDSMVSIQEEPTSIYSKYDDLDYAYQEIADSLTEEELTMYDNVRTFNKSFNTALKAITPQWVLHGTNTTLLDWKAFKQAASLLVNKDNEFHPNVVAAMSTAGLDWLATNGGKSSFLNKETVSRIINADEDSLSGAAVHTLALTGIPAVPEGIRIGKEVLRLLNMKQSQDANKADNLYEDRLAQALGDMILVSMHNMKNSNNENMNLVKFGFVDSEIYSSISKDLPASMTGKTTRTIRVPVKLDKHGFPMLNTEDGRVFESKEANMLNNTMFKNTDYKSMVKKLFGKVDHKPEVSLSPITEVQKYYKGTFSEVSPLLQKAVQKFQSHKLVPNTNHLLFKTMPKDIWLRIHGFKTEDEIANGSEAMEIGARGKNVTVQADYNKMLEHEELIDSLLDSTYGSIDEKAVFNKEEYKAMKNDRGFYIPYQIFKNGRIGNNSSTIAIQSSKMHRNSFSFQEHIQTIDLTNMEHITKVIQSFIEPFDLPNKLAPTDLVDHFFSKVMSQEGVVYDKDVEAALEAINQAKQGKEYDAEAILTAVNKFPEKGHSLLALTGLAAWKEALDNNKDSFVSDMYTEVDGTTNGIIALVMQIQTEYGTNDKKVVRNILNAGGVIFTDQEFTSAMDYLRSGNLDIYQQVGISAATKMDEYIAEFNQKGLGAVQAERSAKYKTLEKLEARIKSIAENNKSVKNDIRTSLLNERAKVYEEYQHLNKVYNAGLISKIIPPYVKEENGEKTISKDGRQAAKPYVMTGGYQAGSNSQIRGAFFTAIPTSEMDKIHIKIAEKYLEGDMNYIKDVNQVITTLHTIGYLKGNLENYLVNTSSFETVRKELHPNVQEALFRAYKQSYGKTIVESYQNALGSSVDNAKLIVEAMSIVATVNAVIINRAIKEAGDTKGSPLNKTEVVALKKKLLKQGIYIGMRNQVTEGDSDVTLLEDKVTKLASENEGGRIELQGFKQVDGKPPIRGEEFTGSILKGINSKPVGNSNTNSSLKSSEVSRSISVTPITNGNLFVDATTQAKGVLRDNRAFGNVFDAKILGVLDATDMSQGTNQDWLDILSEEGLPEFVEERLDFTMNTLMDLLTNEEMYEVEQYLTDTEINRFAIRTLTLKGFKDTYNKFMLDHSVSKSKLMDSIKLLEQYRLEGSAVNVNPAISGGFNLDEDMLDEELNDLFEGMKELKPSNVMKVFYRLRGDSKQEQFLIDRLLPVIRSIPQSLTLGLTNENDKDINVSPYKAKQFLNKDITPQEDYVNQLTAVVFDNVFKNSTVALKAVNDTYNKVKQSITGDMLSPELYDYVFNHPEGVLHFATLSLTNSELQEAIKSVGNIEDNSTVLKTINNLFVKYANKFGISLGKIKSDSTNAILNNIISDMTNIQKSFAYQIMEQIMNNRITNYINNKLPLVVSTLEKGKDSTLPKLTRLAAAMPFSRTIQHSVVNTVDKFLKEHNHNDLVAVYSEMKGAINDRTNRLMNLLRISNEVVESKGMQLKQTILGLLNDHFVSATKEDKRVLHEVLLKSDLFNLDLSMIKNALENGSENLIKQYVKDIPINSRTEAVNQIKSLGHLMVTNAALIKDQLPNGFMISNTFGINEDTVNKLISLYALHFSNDQDKTLLNNMLNTNETGIKIMLDLQKEFNALQLDTIYDGDRSRVIAGNVMDINNTGVVYTIKNHPKPDEKIIAKVKDNSWLYITIPKAKTKAAYQKGIVNLSNEYAEGAFFRKDDPEAQNGLPVYKQGKIIGYRHVVPNKIKKELGITNNGLESLSEMYSHRHKLEKGREFNKELVKEVYDDYINNFADDPKSFVKVSETSDDPRIREFMSVVDSTFKKELATKFRDKYMYIRKDMLDMTIGYRKFSAVDYLGTKFDHIPSSLLSIMKMVEDVWQLVIGEVKRRTVLLTPTIIIGNFVSNFIIGLTQGINPVKLLAYQKEGLIAIKQYTAWENELARAQVELKLKPTKELKAKVAELQYLKSKSNINTLIENGVFSVIADDVAIGDNDLFIGKILDRALPNTTQNRVDKFTNTDMYKKIKPALEIVTLAPSTKLGKNIELATAYSDFMARYASYKHLLSKGMKEQDAIKDIMDIYVDYAPNTSKSLQYLNDMGLLMYTKFFLRIQKVIVKQLRNNATGVMALLMAEQMLGSLPDIMESSLLTGFSLGGRNVNPSEAADMLSDLPMWHFIKGLA